MPNGYAGQAAPGYGPQGFQPSGGPQTMSPEQKLEDMLRMMGGAPNSVLMMIARILGQGGGAGGEQPAAPPEQNWQRLFPMQPARPETLRGINPEPMRPTDPPMMLNPNPGFIRG